MNRSMEIVERLRKRYTDGGVIASNAKIGLCSSFGRKSEITRDAPDEFLLRHVMTTDDLDLDAEIVDPSGAILDYLIQNKSIFIDHQYGLNDSVGMIRWTKRRKDNTGIESQIRLDNGREAAEDCKAVIRERKYIGGSIGYEALLITPPDRKIDPPHWLKARTIVRKYRVIEFSLTLLPCNQSCQSTAYSEGPAKAADIAELVTKGIIRPGTAKLFGFGARSPRLYEMAR